MPEFDEAACICGHPPAAHDDGFGCTEVLSEPPGSGAEDYCPCLAGWVMSNG